MSLHPFPLDGALLFFDRDSGLSVVREGPSVAHLRRRAPRVVQFGITNACNLACAFCSRNRAAESAWTAESAFAVLADLARAGTLEVAFGGGEPFAFRGFDDLVARLHDETTLAVSVTTNGLLLDDARLARLRGKLAQIRVSLYEDNAWRATLRRCADAGHAVGANLLVFPSRLARLEETVLEIVEQGCRDVLLLGYVGSDDALRLSPHQERELAERVRALASALRGVADVKTSVCWGDRLDGVARIGIGAAGDECGAGRDFVVVTSDRKLMPCSFHDVAIPIASAEEVLEVWRARRADLARPAFAKGCGRGPGACATELVPLRAAREAARLWTAFASNNSGSYTLVARFAAPETATAVASELGGLFAEMDAWQRAQTTAVTEPSPIHRFALAQGLADEGPSMGEDMSWPEPGDVDGVVAIGSQLVVHVAYTVTMPRALGELVYRRGGRVEIEIDHAHHDVVALVSFWIPRGWEASRREASTLALAALRTELDALVRELSVKRYDHDTEPTPPAWRSEHDNSLELGFVPRAPARDIARVREVAARNGAETRVRFFEALVPSSDPLADLRERADERPAGAWEVVLWREGADRISTMRALRTITGCDLAGAKALLADLPVAVLSGVRVDVANDAAKALATAGAEASADRVHHR